MALTEVWWRGVNGEWTRTTATEADKEFKYTVSVKSNMFRCYKCFQYVTFVKSTENVSSHFKHSRGDINKNCEDRSSNLMSAYLQEMPLAEFPLKLIMEGTQAALFLGLPPVSDDELKVLSKNNGFIKISCGQYSPAVYKVDSSHFIPNTTNWFALSLSSQFHLVISIKPEQFVPKLWKLPLPKIPREGALFDARTGRRICEKGDIQVGKEYYLLRKRINSLYLGYRGSQDISTQVYHQDSSWTVYKICALRMSEPASEFFFDELHLRLTQQPSDIDILWPPVIQKNDVVDTKQDRIWVYVRGEQDMLAYPVSGNHVTSTLRISPTQKIYEIRNSGTLQMICAERFSQTLQSLYIRPPIVPQIKQLDDIRVTDGNDREITDMILKKIPVGKTLRFLSPVDGTITVEDKEGFCYRKRLEADKETRITDLRYGIRITLRQGCSIVREISINVPASMSNQFEDDPPWRGPLVPFPSRYASILNMVPNSSMLYQRIKQALKKGYIPKEGYLQLLRLMEVWDNG